MCSISWIKFQTIQQVLIAPRAAKERGFSVAVRDFQKMLRLPTKAGDLRIFGVVEGEGGGAIKNLIFPFINWPRVMSASQLVCQSVRSWSMLTIFIQFVIVLQGPPLGARNRFRFDRANCQRASIRNPQIQQLLTVGKQLQLQPQNMAHNSWAWPFCCH